MDINKYREWLLDEIECCKDNAVVFGGISGGHKWQIRAEALEVALREEGQHDAQPPAHLRRSRQMWQDEPGCRTLVYLTTHREPGHL